MMSGGSYWVLQVYSFWWCVSSQFSVNDAWQSNSLLVFQRLEVTGFKEVSPDDAFILQVAYVII